MLCIEFLAETEGVDCRVTTHANVVQIPADLLDVDVALESDPATPEPAPLGLWVGDGGAQEARVPLAHLSSRHCHTNSSVN